MMLNRTPNNFTVDDDIWNMPTDLETKLVVELTKFTNKNKFGSAPINNVWIKRIWRTSRDPNTYINWLLSP